MTPPWVTAWMVVLAVSGATNLIFQWMQMVTALMPPALREITFGIVVALTAIALWHLTRKE